MSGGSVSESTVEAVALDWLASLDWAVVHGPDIAPDTPAAERADYGEVVLTARLRSALARLNPDLPDTAVEDALRRLTRPAGATLEARNRDFHRMLVAGVTVEHLDAEGRVCGAQVHVLDFDDPAGNDWLAVNQFTVVENKHERRPDLVLFVNGLPLAVIELKNPADENATIRSAFQQLQTYKAESPSLFTFNAALIVSDGLEARIGTLTAGQEWFKPWRTIAGETLADPSLPQLQVLLEGVFNRRRLLALVRDFIVFEDDGSGALAKKMAGYHQFHAVQTAVAETLRAAALQQAVAERDPAGRYESRRQPTGAPGDRRIGVVWHTQGSGKSLTMAFYAGRIMRDLAMENPTVVVLTDRNDLDDQLFTTFSRCADLIGLPPVQAESRADLRAKLAVESGGVVFTTIQKFFPDAPGAGEREGATPRREQQREGATPRRKQPGDQHPLLSSRRNIVVIADEAHRSQYDFIDGYARHMRDALPNASFIGFTGTPIELADASTRAVFGDHISVYDIQRAVEDGATVPIYYESRLAKLALDETEKPAIDAGFEEVTEGEEVDRREKLKTKWAQLEAIVGAEKRVALVARDIVDHFERRREAMDGKAMVVCMSRRICIDIYRELVRRRPEWRDDDDSRGALKVVMTGKASDPPDWQRHIGNKARREALAKRFRDPADPLRMVLVRDMWLTGFDAPRPAHDVRGQADAQPRPHAGHRASQPGVPGQAGRAGRRLPRPRPRAQARAGHLHRERRHGRDRGGQGAGGPGDAGEVRGLLRPVPRLRPVGVDGRLAGRAAPAPAGGAGARPRPGGRQGPLPARRAGTVPGVRTRRAASRDDPHSRRRVPVPARPRGALEARRPRREVRRGARSRRAPDRVSGRGPGRRGGHLRRGRTEEAGRVDPVRGVPA